MDARMRAGATTIFALSMLTLVSGCAGILQTVSKPVSIYTPTPKSTFSEALPRVDWQLIVEVPIANESLNTPRIALRHNPVSVQYYNSAKWTERAPVVIQGLLIESFENTGKIIAVGRKSIELRADYILTSELREFQAEYDGDGPPLVRVRLIAKLIKFRQRTIIAAHAAEHVARARSNAMVDIVYAFDEALGKVIKSIVEWTLTAPEEVAKGAAVSPRTLRPSG